MASTRDFKTLATWAENADTVIPVSGAVPGRSYRIPETTDAIAAAGLVFKRALESGSFNQAFFLTTKLVNELESTGMLGWSDLIDYPVDGYVRGSDGEIYRSLLINGPASTVVDPVGDLTGTWIDHLKDIRDALPQYVEATDTFILTDRRDGFVLNLGQESFAAVLNPSVTDITTGQIVRFTGWAGSVPTVALALAGDLTDSSIVGVAATTILANATQTGKMTIFGEVEGVDTSLLSSNAAIFVDDVTPGAFTTVKPVVNAFLIGVVGEVSVTGSLFINTTRTLVDVATSVPASGDRIFLTAEQTTIGDPAGAGIFKASIGDPLTGDATTESVAVGDDSQVVLTEFLGDVRTEDEPIDKGNFDGVLVISVDSTSAEERVFVEVYEALATGASLSSGNGLPLGTEGVSPIVVLDSGIINLSSTSVQTSVNILGNSPIDFVGLNGNRLKFVVVVAKSGSFGGSKTFTLFHGENILSFLNIPLSIRMGDLKDVIETGIGDGDVLVRNGEIYRPGDAGDIKALIVNNTLTTFQVQSQIDELDAKSTVANFLEPRVTGLEETNSAFSGGLFFLHKDLETVNTEEFSKLFTQSPSGVSVSSANDDDTPNQDNLIRAFITDPFDSQVNFTNSEWAFEFYLDIGETTGNHQIIVNVIKMDALFAKTTIGSISQVIVFQAKFPQIDFRVISGQIPSFTLDIGERLVIEVLLFSDQTRTVFLTFGGTASGLSALSKISMPIKGFHNDLEGIQGGAPGDRQHVTQAELDVINGIPQEINDLTDVNTAGSQNGEVLVLSGTEYLSGDAGDIKALTVGNSLVATSIQGQIDELDGKSGGVGELNDLTDVNTVGIADSDIIVRSGAGYVRGNAENINASTVGNSLVATKIQGQIDELDNKLSVTESGFPVVDILTTSSSTFTIPANAKFMQIKFEVKGTNGFASSRIDLLDNSDTVLRPSKPIFTTLVTTSDSSRRVLMSVLIPVNLTNATKIRVRNEESLSLTVFDFELDTVII